MTDNERLADAMGWKRIESTMRSCIEWPDESSCDGREHDDDCEVLERTHYYPKPGLGLFLPDFANDPEACAKWLLPWLQAELCGEDTDRGRIRIETDKSLMWMARCFIRTEVLNDRYHHTFAQAVTALALSVLGAKEAD